MGEVVATLKIMPESPDVDLEALKAAIQAAMPAEAEFHKIEEEPIAFGLVALNLIFIIEDGEGGTESTEEAMAKFMHENELDLFVFLKTDIIANNSQVIALGRQDVVERAFDVKLQENTAFLSGVVSRKKQVVPRIDSFIG